jgi:hypothetical protein
MLTAEKYNTVAIFCTFNVIFLDDFLYNTAKNKHSFWLIENSMKKNTNNNEFLCFIISIFILL